MQADESVERPFVHRYEHATYRGQAEVWSAAQDRRGILYFADGGTEGILEFDGARWRRVPAPPATRALGTDTDGRVWVGAPGAVGYLEVQAGGKAVYVSVADQLSPADREARFDVAFFVPSAEGLVIVAEQRLFLWRDGAMRSWAASTENMYYRVFALDGEVFVAQRHVGLLRLANDEFELIPGVEVPAESEINLLLPAPQGGAWAITLDHGVFHFDGRTLRRHESALNDLLIQLRVQHGVALPNGDFVLATLYGHVLVLAPDLTVRRHLDLSKGKGPEALYFVAVDQEGKLWVTGQEGIAHLDLELPLQVYGPSDGVPSGLTAVRRSGDRLWLLGRGGVFARGQDHRQPTFEALGGLLRETWDLATDGDSLLVATRVGLFYGGPGGWTQHSTASSSMLAQPAANVLFVGQWDGVGRFRRAGSGWRTDGLLPDIGKPQGGPFVVPVEGLPAEIWAVTVDGQVAQVIHRDGFDKAAEVRRVWSLPDVELDDVFVLDGELAVALNGGVKRIDRQRLDQANTDPFVDVPGLSWFVEAGGVAVNAHQSPEGTLWIRLDDRLHAVPRQADGSFNLASASTVPIPGHPNFVSLESSADEPGQLWLTTHDRLWRISRPTGKREPSPYRVGLRHVEHGDSQVSDGDPPVFAFARNEVRFGFSVADYRAGQRPRYRFRLDGYDEDWSAWSEVTTKTYSNLREGHYEFLVEAEQASDPAAAYAFRIRTPWYRSWWAFSLYALCSMVLMVSFTGICSRSLEREKIELEQAVRRQTTALRREKDQVEKQAGELSRINTLLQEENDRRQALEQRVLQAQKLESLEVLASGVAHDFNNLLTGILGNTDLVRQALAQGQTPDDRLDDIAEASRQAAELCEQMLAFSGKSWRQIVMFDLSDVTRSVRDLLAVSLPKMIEVRQDLVAGLPRCGGDISQIRQVIMNVILNAAEALGERPGTIDIVTGVTECTQERLDRSVVPLAALAGRFAFLEVTDSGDGIDPDYLTRIFDPFFSDKFAGRGLGLAAVLGIVRSHRGAIEIKSALQVGTTFRVLLPIDAGFP